MIDTMRGHWRGWHESIPSYWGQCGIAVRKHKFILADFAGKSVRQAHPHSLEMRGV
jgi:hypothetical protein